MKDFLLNKDINGKRVGWVPKVMEYDIDIKVTKLIRHKELSKQIASSFEIPEEVTLLIKGEKLVANEGQFHWS